MEFSNNNAKAGEADNTIKTSKFERRRKIGFLLVGAGAFLCVFGFLITLVLLQNEVNFNVALYGATGLGGLLLFAGMVAIMA